MSEGLLLSMCVIIMVDQLSKWLVIQRFALGLHSSSGSWVRIIPVPHVRKGLWLARHRFTLLGLWAFIVLSSVLLIHARVLFQSQVAQIGLGVAIGGATGNLCDMFRRRAILNFIDLGFWPVFNLADVAIVLGVAVALLFAR